MRHFLTCLAIATLLLTAACGTTSTESADQQADSGVGDDIGHADLTQPDTVPLDAQPTDVTSDAAPPADVSASDASDALLADLAADLQAVDSAAEIQAVDAVDATTLEDTTTDQIAADLSADGSTADALNSDAVSSGDTMGDAGDATESDALPATLVIDDFENGGGSWISGQTTFETDPLTSSQAAHLTVTTAACNTATVKRQINTIGYQAIALDVHGTVPGGENARFAVYFESASCIFAESRWLSLTNVGSVRICLSNVQDADVLLGIELTGQGTCASVTAGEAWVDNVRLLTTTEDCVSMVCDTE